MISVRKYLVYARAPFLSASVMPALLGTALAWRFDHVFSLGVFLLTLIGMVFAHLGVNLINDYYDFVQAADQGNRNRNQFSGGSPHLVAGAENPALIRNLSWLSLGVGLVCGLILMCRVDHGVGPVLWIMLAGFVGGYFYTAPPLKFAYRGWGEFFILLDFGALPVLGAYYVQTGQLAWAPVIASVPIGLLITAVLWINQFPDVRSDREAGKRTLVVRLGTARARYGYLLFLLTAVGFIALPPLVAGFPAPYYIGLLGLVPAAAACIILFGHHADPPKLFKGQALTIVSHIATGILTTVGILL